MSVNLSTIFGPEINVVVQPRDVERSYSGYPGAHGVTTMFLGSRGRRIQISGRIVTNGVNYNLARVSCQTAINAIEAYLWSPAHDYHWGNNVYYACVFDSFRLLGDANGKFFTWSVPGYVVANFICTGRALI